MYVGVSMMVNIAKYKYTDVNSYVQVPINP
jgi:hypothetical protein